MIKKVLLNKSKVLTVLVFLFAFYGNMNAQCSITEVSVLSSSRTCSSFASCPIIYVGDGVNPTSLILNGNLDLTSCSLGPIQLVVNNNANIDFSDQNYDLRLPAGSSITFNGTGTLIAPGGCSASDRIVIGGAVIANCLGSGPPLSFPELVGQGGYNIVNISPISASVCGSGSFTFTATAIPSTAATIRWYDAASGGNLLQTGTSGNSSTFTSPTISTTTTYYAEATIGAFITPRKAVVATVNPLPVVAALGSNSPICSGSNAVFIITGTAGNTVTYTGAVSGTATIGVGGTVNVTVSAVTANTTLNLTNVSNNTCNRSLTATATVSVNALPIGATLSSNSPICSGSNAVFTITGTAGNTVAYTGASAGTATVGAGGTVSVTVSAVTANATLNLTNVSNGNCNRSLTASATVIVTALNAPILSPVTQPTCTVATGSFTITNYNSGYTYEVNPSTGVTVSGNTITAPAGSFTVTATLGSCISAASLSVPITSPDKEWNGSISEDWNTAANWTPSGVPTSSNCVTIPSTLRASIISGTNFVAYANTVTLQISGRLTVNPSNTLAVTDFVSAGSGFLVFENTASLVQINNVNNNSGFIDYKRSTTARQTDYTYWSSPVDPMSLGELYTMGGTFYSYEPTLSGEDWSPFGAGTNMVAGKGYIANRGAAIPLPGPPPPPDVLNVVFTGVPNNGHYEIANVIADRSYLLGNPYPSALDAETFLNDNAGVLNGTLYFWTHNTQIGIGVSNPGTGVYAYSGNDYATYNATGGVAATQRDIDLATGLPYPNPGGGGSAPNGSVIPTGKIASGQGFFASSKEIIPTNSKIIYDNTMRVGVNGITGNNSQFFKTKNPSKSSKPIEKNRIWLNLTNTQGAFKQTLIGYITDATNDYDDRFDGGSFDGNEFVDFYSIDQDKNLVIQGRALPFDENDEVPLGFRTTINGAFTINIDQVDGSLTDQAVFIEDKLTNTVFDLKSGNYTFNTVEGTFDNRFVLRFKDNSTAKTLAAATFDSLEKTVLVSNKNKQIKIDSAVERIDKVTVYDLLGRQIFQKTNVDSNELSITNLVISQQTLLVKIALQNGNAVTRKIIY